MTQHILKLPEPYFSAVESGAKTFEARRNDRAYQAGDSLLLYDLDACKCDRWDCEKRRPALLRLVTFVFAGDPNLRDLGGLVPGYVVLGMVPVNEELEAIYPGHERTGSSTTTFKE